MTLPRNLLRLFKALLIKFCHFFFWLLFCFGGWRVRVQTFQCADGTRGSWGKVGRELNFLTGWWMKLSLGVLVLAWRLCSLLPNGSRLRRLCFWSRRGPLWLAQPELCAARPLYGSTLDDQRGTLVVCFPEVRHNLLCLLQVPRQIIVTAPLGRVAHLNPVLCLVSVAD